MEARTAKQPVLVGKLPTKKLLRLASEERLVALTRAGNERAFEVLVERYRARLLAFCRHMLASKEDAEDVLQDVFVAAYNALLADERPVNVRPWLYRIARNRCLNELRRKNPAGVDSMDVYLGEGAESVSDRILQKERVRHLVEDIGQLPESQRTALLLRELDDLSYEQIAEAMETTVSSVKSLLVRARVALAEAAEARALSCADVRVRLGEEAEGLAKLTPPYRRHLRSCESCRAFRKQLRRNDRLLAALLPVGVIPALQRLVISHLPESSAYLGGGSAAGALGASASSSSLGSLLGLGGGAVATKAAAGLATVAIVAAGAVAAEQTIHHPPHRHPVRKNAEAGVKRGSEGHGQADHSAAGPPLLPAVAAVSTHHRAVRTEATTTKASRTAKASTTTSTSAAATTTATATGKPTRTVAPTTTSATTNSRTDSKPPSSTSTTSTSRATATATSLTTTPRTTTHQPTAKESRLARKRAGKRRARKRRAG
jgi:RNA polymerase sigma factor (sigma-70 family)